MGANYSHTQRGAITLTPEIYNADHQNHIDNAIPTLFDDYSASVSQMALTTNPGAVGSESLATTLAGELERLRYVLAAIHGGDAWYDSPAVPLLLNSNTVASLVGHTAFSVTGIPSGVKRLVINLFDATSDAATDYEIVLGTSLGDSFSVNVGATMSRYSSTTVMANSGATHTLTSSLSSLIPVHGQIVCNLADSATNTWIISSQLSASSITAVFMGTSRKILPGVLTQFKLRSVNTAAGFTDGKISIFWE